MPKNDLHDLREVYEKFDDIAREEGELPYTHPEYYLLIWRKHVHLPGAVWFNGTSEDELADFVLHETNVTREEFENQSNKGFGQLLEENRNETKIVRLMPGRLRKLSAKIRTSIRATADEFWLRETGRHVIKNGHDVLYDKPKVHGSSGTIHRIRGDGAVIEELPRDAVPRELQEELGLDLRDAGYTLTAINPQVPVVLGPRPSTMYGCPGIVFESIEAEWRFQVDAPSIADFHERCPKLRPCGNQYEYEDDDLFIRVNWLPGEPKWRD